MQELNLISENNQSKHNCPLYSERLYVTIANQYIGKEVVLPASRKKRSSKYFIEYVNKIPRSIQQRLAVGNAKSWNNMVYLYNSFADELGYEKITSSSSRSSTSTQMRMYDSKEDTGVDYGYDNMVYMSDGIYIHKDDAWW